MGTVTLRIRDYDKEGSGFSLATPAITSVNINDYIAADAAIDDLVAAVNAVVLGTIEKATLLAYDEVVATALPTDKFAQRETKALIGYHDSVTGNRYTFTIPTVDLDLLPATRSGEFDITAGAWATLVGVLETSFVSPDGNLMVVDYAKHVGRNV